MRYELEISASPLDRRRVCLTPSAVLTLGNSLGLVCHGVSASQQKATETSTTQTQTATDEAVISAGPVAQSGGAATGGEGSPILGTGALNVGAGGLLSGNQGTITITSADAAALEKGLESLVSLSALQSTGLKDLANQQQDATSSNLGAILDSISNLAESKQTEGASLISKTFLWIGLAVAAVFAIFAWRRA